MGKTRELNVLMTPASRKAFAIKCAIAGFAASGKGFNGEVFDREKYPRIESMLVAHFEKLYEDGKL